MTARILHVNVRLSEGGAAGVARSLCEEQQAAGLDVRFAYGYGPHGMDSPLSTGYPSIRLTPRLLAGFHQASHACRGHEVGLTLSRQTADLTRAIEWADLVHLHVVHSYFINPTDLLEQLVRHRKPVVWTLHDHWIMTGRCAQPAACTKYETGCVQCPDLAAYPPATVDRAAEHWQLRRQTIAKLQRNVPTAIVACADWIAQEARDAGFANVMVVKNSVDAQFWNTVTQLEQPEHRDRNTRAVFVCRDLRDRQKVDWDLLRSVGRLENVDLTIVGDNAPDQVPGSRRVGALNSRSELAELLHQQDLLLFTSRVDYYPLTIAEAATARTQVAAIDSPAAREFSHLPEVSLFGNPGEISRHVAGYRSPARAPGLTDAQKFFHPQRMTGQYMDLYQELLEKRSDASV